MRLEINNITNTLKSILVLVFITSVNTLNGQYKHIKYPQPGMVQGEICYGDFTNPGEYNASITYLKDTLIGMDTFSLFESKHFYFGKYVTRYKDGKIFTARMNANNTLGNEMLLYDFNLNVGDTFYTWMNEVMVVDSVSFNTALNGSNRKFIHFKNTRNDVWVDGIGDVKNGFFYYRDFEGGHEVFVCHKDSSGLVYSNNTSPWDCDSLILGPSITLLSSIYLCQWYVYDIKIKTERLNAQDVKWYSDGDGNINNSQYTPGIGDNDRGEFNLYPFIIRNGKTIILDTFTIYFVQLPDVSIGILAKEACPPYAVTLTTAITNNGTIKKWDFGDGSFAFTDSLNEVHLYQTDGKYKIGVTAETKYGCKGYGEIELNLESDSCSALIYVPSSFTPNGDNLNDLFDVRANSITTYRIDIYSNQNEHLFSSNSIFQSWNGTYKGMPVQNGNYMFIIYYRGKNSKEEKMMSGKVMVLR